MRQCQGNDTLFVFLDQGLHRTPKKLREKVQREIDRVSGTNDCFVLLGYGLCSGNRDGDFIIIKKGQEGTQDLFLSRVL